MLEGKKPSAGNVFIRINNKLYEVPDVPLFKTKSNKDVYLSGISMTEQGYNKYKTMATVKIIEENKYEEVPFELIEKFINYKFRKIVIDNDEYDIPLHMIDELKSKLSKLHKKDIRSLNLIKEEYNKYIFKQN
jgi:hypothetical protein